MGFFDADIRIAPDLFEQLLPVLNPALFYLPVPMDPNCMGSCIVPRLAFEKLGGYDEAIDGWGGEDKDLYTALEHSGMRQAGFPGSLLKPIPHADDERTRFYGFKNVDRSIRLGHLYNTIKYDLIRLTGKAMALERRQQLRRTLEELILMTVVSRTSKEFKLVLADRRLKTRPPLPLDQRPLIRTCLSYELLDYGDEQPNAD